MSDWPNCPHAWYITGVGKHFGSVIMVRCMRCGQRGYRPSERQDLIYTWLESDPPEGIAAST